MIMLGQSETSIYHKYTIYSTGELLDLFEDDTEDDVKYERLLVCLFTTNYLKTTNFSFFVCFLLFFPKFQAYFSRHFQCYCNHNLHEKVTGKKTKKNNKCLASLWHGLVYFLYVLICSIISTP